MHKKSLLFIGLLVLVVLFFVFMRGPRDESSEIPDAVKTAVVDLQNGATYELTADYVMKTIGGTRVKMLAYNGMIPGPTLRMHEGDNVTIRFINKTDMPTLLHSHGVRMQNAFDGSQLVQKEMAPGESFDYQLAFADPGVYWYHPHVREDKQQVMGLYGNFIVVPQDVAYWSPVDHEETLFLSDLLIEGGAVAPYSDNYVTHALMGRFGNTLLLNGETNYTVNAKPGELHRFFVTNAAATRTFNFGVKGAQVKLVGGDNGRYEKETFVDAVVLAPSERAVIEVYFKDAGLYVFENQVPEGAVYSLGQVVVSGTSSSLSREREFVVLRVDPVLTEAFGVLKSHLLREPDKTLRLTVNMDMEKIMSYMSPEMMSAGGHAHGAETDMSTMMGAGSAVPIEWEDHAGAMNVFSTSDTVTWVLRDEATGKENMDIDWKFIQGDLVKIRIMNDPTSMHPMQHPIHFHGNRFVVLERNGVPNDNMVWKDTTLVQTGDTLDILLEASNLGKWMTHCHIAEHLHSGMMFGYEVQ